jgi:hypothetical protein
VIGGGGGPFPTCTIIFSKFWRGGGGEVKNIFQDLRGSKKFFRFKTLFLHQYLLHLGLENFLSHHYLYKKTFQIIFLWFSKFGGHPYTVPLIGPVNL